MARITVEDCLKKIPNRFQLVLAAAYRARQLAHVNMNAGLAPIARPKFKADKPVVCALREVAEGQVTTDILKNAR